MERFDIDINDDRRSNRRSERHSRRGQRVVRRGSSGVDAGDLMW